MMNLDLPVSCLKKEYLHLDIKLMVVITFIHFNQKFRQINLKNSIAIGLKLMINYAYF